MSQSGAYKPALAGAEIRINRDSEIPLHKQLVEQIIVLIATGNLEPDERLPTVRQLARQKNIHYNTVSRAYRELVADGWLLRRSGRALTVRALDAAEEQPRDLDDLIDLTIRLARQCGYTMEQLGRRVSERFAARRDHILIVSTDAGICDLLKAELEPHLSCSVRTCSLDDLSAKFEITTGAIVVCLLGGAPTLRPLLPKGCPVFSLTICDTHEPLERIRRMREPSLIALVSISELFLQRASGILAPVIGDRHSLREYLLTDDGPISLEAADLVLCDSVAFRRVQAHNVFRYYLISAESLEKISNRVGHRKAHP